MSKWFESQTYVKMCESAKEIQAHRGRDEIQSGSYRFVEGEIQIAIGHVTGISVAKVPYATNNTIWLPRQDQLQEMIGNFETCKNALFSAGYNDNEYSEYWDMPNKYWNKFTSMEQLWLAFVMREKYNKMWDGESWKERIC